VAYSPSTYLKEHDSTSARWLRGGYAETFAVLDGALLAAVIALLTPVHAAVALLLGAVLCGGLWWVAARRS